jgi:hypothetical protein
MNELNGKICLKKLLLNRLSVEDDDLVWLERCENLCLIPSHSQQLTILHPGLIVILV